LDSTIDTDFDIERDKIKHNSKEDVRFKREILGYAAGHVVSVVKSKIQEKEEIPRKKHLVIDSKILHNKEKGKHWFNPFY
jgi:hypothetical protein